MCVAATYHECADEDDKILANALWIHDKGLGPEHWPSFLEMLCKHTELLLLKCEQNQVDECKRPGKKARRRAKTKMSQAESQEAA